MEITQLSIRQPAKHSRACLLLWIVTSASRMGTEVVTRGELDKAGGGGLEGLECQLYKTHVTTCIASICLSLGQVHNH